jgi:hypothetical protein
MIAWKCFHFGSYYIATTAMYSCQLMPALSMHDGLIQYARARSSHS